MDTNPQRRSAPDGVRLPEGDVTPSRPFRLDCYARCETRSAVAQENLMKNPLIVFIGLLVFAALVAAVWAPSWMLGLGGSMVVGSVELGGGLLGGLFGTAVGVVGAVFAVLAAIVAILIAVPLALVGVVGALLFAAAVVAVVLLGLAAPLLVPVLLIWAVVWLARRSGPRPPVPGQALPAPLHPAG